MSANKVNKANKAKEVTALNTFLASMALLASLACVAEGAGYTGKYASHPDWPALQQLVESSQREAQQAVALALGITIPEDFQVEITFEDFPEKPNKDIQTATTMTKVVNGRHKQFILFRPELHFGHLVNMKTEILHEMTHAVMRGLLKERHKPVPKWVREGLAVWVARQGQEKMVINLASHLGKVRPENALVNGLDTPHSIQDYPEDYLAMAYLESLGGPRLSASGAPGAPSLAMDPLLKNPEFRDAESSANGRGVRHFVSLMVAGQTYLEAIEKSSGQSWEDFQREAGRFAKVTLAALFAEEHALHQDAIRHYQNNRLEKALDLYEKIIQLQTPFKSSARYYQGRCLQMLQRFTEAEAVFASVLSVQEGPNLGGLLDEAAFHFAECARQQGLVDEAARRYQRVERDYPYSPLAEKARSHLADLRPTSDQPEMDEADSDHDAVPSSYTLPKPAKLLREYMERLKTASHNKDFDTLKEELLRWDPLNLEDGALEMRRGHWKGILPWMADLTKQFTSDQRQEILGQWNARASKISSTEDPTEAAKHQFLWPGELPVKQAVLAKAGLEAWDNGLPEQAWPFLQESRISALAPLQHLWPSAIEAQVTTPVFTKQWVWKASSASPPASLVSTPGWIWTILRDGSIWMIDDQLGQAAKDGQGKEGPVVKKTGSLNPILLPRAQTVVLHNPSSPRGFLNFIDLASAETWNVLLPDQLFASTREPRATVQYAIAPCSSPERLFLIETTPIMGMAQQEFSLHLWKTSQSRPSWSRELGNLGNAMVQIPVPQSVILGEFGSRWVALHSERVVLTGNVLSGALEWISELPEPEVDAAHSVPPVPRSLQPLAKAGFWVEGNSIVCTAPSRRAVYVLNRTDGTIQWWKTFPSEPHVVGLRRGRAIISTHQQVAAYGLEDGKVQWETPAPGVATRNGEGALFRHLVYLPWGNQVSVMDADAGTVLGAIDRALTKWCSLAVTPDRVYEFSDDGIAAWQSSTKK